MKVTSSHALMFVKPKGSPSKGALVARHDEDSFSLKPTAVPVEVPDWVRSDRQFIAARNSGWVQVDTTDEEAKAHDAAVLSDATDEDLMTEFRLRLATKEGFESKAQKFFADREDGRLDPDDDDEDDDDEELVGDDPLKKSSGIDGDAGDWTQMGETAEGFPVTKGSPEDVKATDEERAAYAAAKALEEKPAKPAEGKSGGKSNKKA